MKKKYKIFVTGASGFIGTNLLADLIDQNYQVYGSIRRQINDFESIRLVEYININFSSVDVMKKIINKVKPDYIVHLASAKKNTINNEFLALSKIEDYRAGVGIIEAAKICNNLKKIIYLGSCDEYGDSVRPFKESNLTIPSNDYGQSKLEITKLFLKYYYSNSLPVIILRPSLIYGPNQKLDMFMPKLIHSLLDGVDFKMTMGEQYRDYIFIEDVIYAIKIALKSSLNLNGNIFNIASGESKKIVDIAFLVANLIDPLLINNIKLGEIPYRTNELWDYSVDISKAKRILKWSPKFSMTDGLIKTINSYNN